ncbi:MAG TPA: glycoside hydrolase family 2 TIM barrel-domain containing protein [Longimicrobiales bacterium]|nr:glycoside hydrolase family 2 TIM barrel-domain containing protein [Longimicrobiales bacterium]
MNGPRRTARSLLVRHAAVALAAAALASLAPRTVSAQGRTTANFDAAWRFHRGDVPAARAGSFDDSGWRMLDLPHDWSIEGPFGPDNPAGARGGALPGGIGWYRKTFTVPASDRGKLLFIDFDGVYRDGEVWINGHDLGKRPYGYSSFRYELTPYLRYGADANVVAVRVDNAQQPNSRWYSGSGIDRHVWLVTTDPVHVAHWGTYITTPQVTSAAARVRMRTVLQNETSRDRPVTLRTVIYDEGGREVASASSDVHVPADATLEVRQGLSVPTPSLWSPDAPTLYHAVSRVQCGRRLCDDVTTPLGIRTFTFDARRGFLLNGQHVEIRGVCLHHDLGPLGAALNDRALERELEIMKQMGVNAIRTSHNPPAPELLDLADRMGFIVMDEAFDGWKMAKTKYDYHLDWDTWHARDLSDMVRRDRNHPSVFLWSIGNEVREQGDSSGIPIARELAGIVRRLDDTRPVTAGLDHPDTFNYVIRSGALDVIGVNYHSQVWPNLPAMFPGQRFIVTEATSSLNTRGYYPQPSDSVARFGGPWMENPGPTPNKSYRLSDYDNRAAAWGALHEESLRALRAQPFLAGMFIWTGFDYLGEPTPYGWPARSSYFGAVDLAGFPKSAFYLYRSLWTDQPVLHVFPHWNWQKGDTVDVWAYTNADSVALSLNGRPLGVRRMQNGKLHLMWRVAYQPGVLSAVSWKDGQVMARREVRTAGNPASLHLAADRDTLRADGADLAFVTVTAQDADGVDEPKADDWIHLHVDGDATIAGVGNGDEISHASFQADSVRLFYGTALVILRAGKRPGTATLTATSGNLTRAMLRVSLNASGNAPARPH